MSGAGSAALQASIERFDVALVDEAAQLIEAEASIILAVCVMMTDHASCHPCCHRNTGGRWDVCARIMRAH